MNNNRTQPYNQNAFNPPNSGMSIYNPTYDQFVIKPPERNKTHGRISQKLVVDSRDRDYTLYPKPNKYRYDLEEEYKDVISVELVLGEFPNTVYNIFQKNNQIILSLGEDENRVCKKFILDEGEYTNESFLDYLNGSKGNIFQTFADSNDANDAYFNFYLDPDTHILKIQSNKQFTFNLDYNIQDKFLRCNQGDIDKYYQSVHYESIDRTLGFARKAHTAETKFDERKDCTLNDIQKIVGITSSLLTTTTGYVRYSIKTSQVDMREYFSTGDYLDFDTKGIYRIVEIINKNEIIIEDFLSNGDPNGSDINPYYAIYSDRAFDLGCPEYIILDIPQFHYLKGREASIAESYAIIPLNEKCKTIVNSGHISLDKEIKYFNPPLARLNHMDINFLRYDGSLVDFKGNEHMMAFKITCLNQPGKYNNFNENVF